MAGTEIAIAEKILPVLIKKMLPNLKDVANLVNIILSNIYSYGYQSKKIITDQRLQVFSEFMPIAENFFENLNDAINMSMQLNDQRYNKIIDFIIKNETVPFKTKIESYIKLDEQKHKQKINYLKWAAGIISTTILGIVSISTAGQVNTNKSYNKRKSKEAKYKYKQKRK